MGADENILKSSPNYEFGFALLVLLGFLLMNIRRDQEQEQEQEQENKE